MTQRAQKTFRQPITYEVGKDITQDQYEELVVKVADWFREWRSTDAPAADARFRIKCCLEGKNLKGEPWYSHWNSSFATRMRMLCRFDFDKMEPIRTGDEKRKQAKDKARKKETEKRLAGTATNDPFIPPVAKQELDGRVNYGAKAIPVTENEAELWQKFHQSYTDQFPELRTINAQAELSMLCDLHVVHERNRLKLLTGKGVDTEAMNDTTKLMADLKKALGIHPDQLAKRVREEEGSSIADAAARYEAMPKELRDKFFAEELLLLFQQYVTPSPRAGGDGYQLDDIGLFGQTRCRTCHCAKCGHRNFVGLSFDEVTDHLVQIGYLEPLETPVDAVIAASTEEPSAPEAGVVDDPAV